MAEPPLDRRPIASRNLPVFQSLAARLAAARVSPDAISAAGMVAGIAAGLAFVATGAAGAPGAPGGSVRAWFVAAAALIQLRLVCNLLDGMVAVARSRASRLGELWNEIPDRVSDVAILAGAGFAAGGGGERLGWIAACVALFVAYLRALGKAAGARNEFCGPMAKSHRMATLTVAALLAAGWPRFRVELPELGPVGWIGLALVAVVVLGLATAARRIARIAAQLRSAQ